MLPESAGGLGSKSIGTTGFSERQISPQKGSFYDVEKIALSNVFINIEGQSVRVPSERGRALILDI
jgi:hypothetical protein